MSSSASEIADEIERAIRTQGRAELSDAVAEVAGRARDHARGLAPVDSGEFKDSIQVTDRADEDGLPAAQVVSDDPKAHLIEYGTVDTPEFAVFARTAAHFDGNTR